MGNKYVMTPRADLESSRVWCNSVNLKTMEVKVAMRSSLKVSKGLFGMGERGPRALGPYCIQVIIGAASNYWLTSSSTNLTRNGKVNDVHENSANNDSFMETSLGKSEHLSDDDTSLDKSMNMSRKTEEQVELDPSPTFPRSILDVLTDEEKKYCQLCWTLSLGESTKNDTVYLNQELGISATVGEFASLFPRKFVQDSVIDMVACELTIAARKQQLSRIYLPTYFQSRIYSWVAQTEFPSVGMRTSDDIVDGFHLTIILNMIPTNVTTCEKVYIPIIDGKAHWFLIVVDIVQKQIQILDSLPESRTNDRRVTLVRELLHEAGRFATKMRILNHLFRDVETYPIHVQNVAVQALRSNDSGMHVIKYMEANQEYEWGFPFQGMGAERLRKLAALWVSVNNECVYNEDAKFINL